jgi:hypothetical protein
MASHRAYSRDMRGVRSATRPPSQMDYFRRIAFGLVIRARREGMGVDAPACAAAVGMDLWDFISVECAEVLPEVGMVWVLADALGTTGGKLLEEAEVAARTLASLDWLLPSTVAGEDSGASGWSAAAS